METIISIRPLLAILVSTAGAFLIILTGEKKPNLREFWSIAAGVLKFLIVVSMVPAILDGKTIEYTLFHLLPGIDIKFKVDAFSILFALGASFLWILTSFYSIGYMRTLDEHAQTRYFTFFAVALSATMGVAFSANLFTMFLFYEGLTIVTYPLVGHKDTDEARAGARKYVVYLLGAAKAFLVAAIILTYNLAGTLEFTKNGLFPPAVQDANPLLFPLYLSCSSLICKVRSYAIPWLAACCNGGADACKRPASCGCSGQDRGLYSFTRYILCLWRRSYEKSGRGYVYSLLGLINNNHGLCHCPEPRQSKGKACLLHYKPTLLYNSRRSAIDAEQHGWRYYPYNQSCLFKDNIIFLCRLHICLSSQDRDKPVERYRQKDAVDNGSLCNCNPEHDRCSACERFYYKVVPRCRFP